MIVPSMERLQYKGDLIQSELIGWEKIKLGLDILGWDAIHQMIQYMLCVKSQ